MERDFDLNRITPRPGLEPGSKAPQASRMSTTLPGQGVSDDDLTYLLRFNGLKICASKDSPGKIRSCNTLLTRGLNVR
jgi:hypothetical protein